MVQVQFRYALGFSRTDTALVLGVLRVDVSDVVVEIVPVCVAEPQTQTDTDRPFCRIQLRLNEIAFNYVETKM